MSTSTKVTRARIRAILKEARELMNDEGRHWIQGIYKRRYGKETRYCSVGAIQAVTTNNEERRAAIEALVVKGLERKPGYIESQIIGWNDTKRRKWSDIDKAFRKAVRALR